MFVLHDIQILLGMLWVDVCVGVEAGRSGVQTEVCCQFFFHLLVVGGQSKGEEIERERDG